MGTNSINTEAREKNMYKSRILEICGCMFKYFKNNKIFVNKICHQFLGTAMLFMGWNILLFASLQKDFKTHLVGQQSQLIILNNVLHESLW